MLRTTNKQVIAYLKDHVLENFATDNGWTNPDRVANLREQLDAMRHNNRSIYQTALDYVEGGSFLVYYGDIRKQLAEWLEETDEEANRFDDDKVWRLYCHLIARTMAQLYERGA